jgi:putative MATE family efflux protein
LKKDEHVTENGPPESERIPLDPDGQIEPPELIEPIPVGAQAPPPDSFILKGSVVGAIFRLAWPLWIGLALQDAYSLVDLFWVGKLGKEAVAAVALCGVLMGLVFTIAVGISTGVVAMVSRLFGEGKPDEAWIVAWQALFMGLGAGVLATIVGIPLARPALALLGAKADVLVMGTEYLQVMAVGAGTIFVTFAMNSSLRGAGDTVTPMIAMILGTVINIVLDPILIFGWIGFPALGVTGSAVATVAAQAVGMVFVFTMLFSGRVPIRLRLAEARIRFSHAWRLFRIGAFGSVQMWVRNIATLIVIGVVTPLGDGVLAAFGIGIRLLMVVLLPGFGIGNAAATVVGQNLGAGRPARAVKAGWAASMFYLAIVACFSLLFAAFPRSIVSVFNDDPEVVASGASLLCWFAMSFPFVAFGLILARAMFGAGDTFSPMWITALCLMGIQVPGAILLSRAYGYDGIWLSIAAANSFNGILTAVWYHRGRWVKKKV